MTTTLHLAASAADAAPPQGIVEVMKTLLKNIVDNPVKALMTANYIGILGWALIIGGALRHAPMNTKEIMESIAQSYYNCSRFGLSALLLLVLWVL